MPVPKEKRPSGFTLIELMIVIAIIAILTAVALPRFITYRKQAINSQAVSAVGVFKNGQAALNQDIGCFGISDQAALPVVVGGNGIGAVLPGSNGVIPAATQGIAGALLTGDNVDTGAISGVGVSVPNGVDLRASTEGANNATYEIVAEAKEGNRAYGIDGDSENSLYMVQNEAWLGIAGINATPPTAITTGINDFVDNGAAGGGAPTVGWTLVN